MATLLSEFLDVFSGHIAYRLQGRYLSFEAFSTEVRRVGGTLIGWNNSHWWTAENIVETHPQLPWKRSPNPVYGSETLFYLKKNVFLSSLQRDYTSVAFGKAFKVSLVGFESLGETECYDELLGELPKLSVVLVDDFTHLLAQMHWKP